MAEYRLLVQGTLVVLSLLSSTLAATFVDSSTSSNRSCIAYERDALLSVKASLLDPNNYLSSWQGEDCCSWKGVKCSKKTGHVVKLKVTGISTNNCLYLNSNELGGEISYSLVNLQRLRYLDLSCNNFNGAKIPEFLGSMRSLRHLDLEYTMLQGRIPPQFGNLTKLVYLSLRCWGWSNPVKPFLVDLAWVSQLSSLKHLDLSYVNLSTTVDWVRKINMLPNLEELYLSESDLSPSLPLRQFNLTRLKVLDISRNNFYTTFAPNWFWNASSLVYLNIKFCYFYGSIPDELGKMTSLQQVSFRDNYISTMIPPSFKNLCNLKVLDLLNSNTTGDITELMERLPNCRWNKLQYLDLSVNNIGGVLPNRSGPLSNLTYLALAVNKLTGKIPSWIWTLRKLIILELSWNQINGIVKEDHLNKLTNLLFLGLGNTSIKMKIRQDWIPPFKLEKLFLPSLQLGPAFPSWLKSQTSIQFLYISNASITTVPDWFWVVFSRADFLNLADNQISGALPATMESMAARTMILKNNRFNGTVPKFPENITYIDISGNSLSGALPSDFGAPLLRSLILYNNSISGTLPFSVCSLKSLLVLDLSENMLSGEVPNCQEDMNFLKVKLNANNLSGEFPPGFRRFPDIVFIDLSYNQFHGNLPVWIWEKMPFLVFLSLRSNMFQGPIPSNIAISKELQYLDLANNNLSGSIPDSLGNLSAMARTSGYSPILEGDNLQRLAYYLFNELYIRYGSSEPVLVSTKGQQRGFSNQLMSYTVVLDLSCNSLTGGIPKDIDALIGLKAFNLSWNRLDGVIPVNISQLKQLESLDLSHNELSGEIPSSMSALTFLSIMNLSYNDLSGKIPTGNQFESFNASAYIGNIGLCGPPLTESCPGNSSNRDTNGNHRDLEDITLYLAMITGFVFNLWVVFCVMLFKKSWRVIYFVFVDELYDKIYVSVVVKCAILKGKFGTS
ncbi:unnamed protein product [Urochloa humidicola]